MNRKKMFPETQIKINAYLQPQQKGIINTLLQSMPLPFLSIGNSSIVQAASCKMEPSIPELYRTRDAIEMTANQGCPAPTYPCRDPIKYEEDCMEEKDVNDEDCENDDEEDEDDCDDDEEDEDEDDCIEEREEEECEEDIGCVCDEEEEEDDDECIEEEEEAECTDEEEENEDCIEEEEDDEPCNEEEEEEEECIEEKKVPICPPAKKSSETQTKEKLTEKICNGKRQICLELPVCEKSKKEKKVDTESKKETNKKQSNEDVDLKKTSKKDIEPTKSYKKELKCTTGKEEKREVKRRSDCYDEEELKRICRKYRGYDEIRFGQKIGQAPSNKKKPDKETFCKTVPENRRKTRMSSKEQEKCDEEEEDEDDEECDEDNEPEYHPEDKFNPKGYSPKPEENYAQNKQKQDKCYYFNKKFTERQVKPWEKCSNEGQKKPSNFTDSCQSYLYFTDGLLKEKFYSPATGTSSVKHQFKHFENKNCENKLNNEFNSYVFGAYNNPNMNNNYNGYVVPSKETYSSSLNISRTASSDNRGFGRCLNDTDRGESEDSSDEDIAATYASDNEYCVDRRRTANTEPLALKEDTSDTTKCSKTSNAIGGDGDNNLSSCDRKYIHYGQTSVGDEEDEYYTTSTYDMSKKNYPMPSWSCDDQIYNTREHSPVRIAQKKKSPKPSMFDTEQLVIESSEASDDSIAEYINGKEVKNNVIFINDAENSNSFSLSDFTNHPIENLKRVFTSLKKKALGIEGEMEDGVPLVCNQGESHSMDNILQSSANKTVQRKIADANTKSGRQVHSNKKKIAPFMYRTDKNNKKFIQLANQSANQLNFKRKRYLCNDSKQTKAHYLLSNTLQETKDCEINSSINPVIEHIVEVLGTPNHEESITKNDLYTQQPVPSKVKSTVIKKGSEVNYQPSLGGLRNSITNQPIRLQSYHVKSSLETKKGRITSYSVAHVQSLSQCSLKIDKENFQPEMKTAFAAKIKQENKNPDMSAQRLIQKKGFRFREMSERKEMHVKDIPKFDFLRAAAAITSTLPFFKRTQMSGGEEMRSMEDSPFEQDGVMSAPPLTTEEPIKHKEITKSNPKTFLSKKMEEKDPTYSKFLKQSLRVQNMTDKKTSKPKKAAETVPKPLYKWLSPKPMLIGPIYNGQKLYDYRKSKKAKKIEAIEEVLAEREEQNESISSLRALNDEMEDFHESLINMEICDSAKMIRKKIRQVNYAPEASVYDSSDSSCSDSEDVIPNTVSQSDSWYCDVPVNIVRTQELYRNQKKTSTIMDEIISLTKQRNLSENVADCSTEEEETKASNEYLQRYNEESKVQDYSECEQVQVSPQCNNNSDKTALSETNCTEMKLVDSEDVPRVEEDQKDEPKDSETFLAFNGNVLNHISRILSRKISINEKNYDDDEKIINYCQSPFELAGKKPLDHNRNSSQTLEDIAENNTKHFSSPPLLIRPRVEQDANDLSELAQCHFRAESSDKRIASSDKVALPEKSPRSKLSRKMPFQSGASTALLGINGISRSNSDAQLKLKGQTSLSIHALSSNENLLKTSPEKCLMVTNKRTKKKITYKNYTAPALRNEEPVRMREPDTTPKPSIMETVVKKANIWMKLHGDKSSERENKMAFKADKLRSSSSGKISRQPSLSEISSPRSSSKLVESFGISSLSKSAPLIKPHKKRSDHESHTAKRSSEIIKTDSMQKLRDRSDSRLARQSFSSPKLATVLTPSVLKEESKVQKCQFFQGNNKPKSSTHKPRTFMKKKESQENLGMQGIAISSSHLSLNSKSGIDVVRKKSDLFKNSDIVKNSAALASTSRSNILRGKLRSEQFSDWLRLKNKETESKFRHSKEDLSTSRKVDAGKHSSNEKYKHTFSLNEKKKPCDKSNLQLRQQELRKYSRAIKEKKSNSDTTTFLSVSTENQKHPSSETDEKKLGTGRKISNEDVRKGSCGNSSVALNEITLKHNPLDVHEKSNAKMDDSRPVTNDSKILNGKQNSDCSKRAVKKKISPVIEEREKEDKKRIFSVLNPLLIEDKYFIERQMQELKRQYQRDLEKKFSKTGLVAEEKREEPKPPAKRMYNIPHAKSAFVTSADFIKATEPAEKANVYQRKFRSFSKTDIFEIPNAATKTARSNHPSAKSRHRSRSRSTSKYNRMSPKMSKRSEQKNSHTRPCAVEKKKNYGPTVSTIQTSKKKIPSDDSVHEPTVVPAPATVSNVSKKTPSNHTDGAQEAAVSKKTTGQGNKAQAPSAPPRKQHDISIIYNAIEAIGEALNTIKLSVPISQKSASKTSVNSDASKEAPNLQPDIQKKITEETNTIKNTLLELEGDANKSTLLKNEDFFNKKENIKNATSSTYGIYSYARPTVLSTRYDTSDDYRKPLTAQEMRNSFKPPALFNNRLNDAASSENPYYSDTRNNKADQLNPQRNEGQRSRESDDDYSRYADFHHHIREIRESQQKTKSQPSYTPKPISYQYSRPLAPSKSEPHRNTGPVMSKPENDRNTKDNYNHSEFIHPTVISKPMRRPVTPPMPASSDTKKNSPQTQQKVPDPKNNSPEPKKHSPEPMNNFPEPKKKSPEIIRKSSPSSETIKTEEIKPFVEKTTSEITKAPVGMITKLINTFGLKKRPDDVSNNNNSNSTPDDFFSDANHSAHDCLKFEENCQHTTLRLSEDSLLSHGLQFESELNSNNNADSYMEFRKRLRQEREERNENMNIDNESGGAAQYYDNQTVDKDVAKRIEKCFSGLIDCAADDESSMNLLNTLIEWNAILMVVFLLLLLGIFVPGSLTKIFACPLPSASKELQSQFLSPLGLDLLIFKWLKPHKSSFWKSPFVPKEPRAGLIYSYLYQTGIIISKIVIFFFTHVIFPLLSIPLIIIGPILSALIEATFCVASTIGRWVYVLALAIVGADSGASEQAETKPRPGDSQVSSRKSTTDKGEMFTKLSEFQQYANLFVYFGQTNMKKECNFSILHSVFLWITFQYPQECQ